MYATPMIIGEIRRYLRDNNSVRVSRSIKDTAYKAMQIKEKLMAEHQEEPPISEIAKELNLSESEVVIALESIVSPMSLYDPVYSDGTDTIFVLDQVGDHNDDKNWLDEIALKEAIKEKIHQKDGDLVGQMVSEGTTPRRLTDLIGSLCDLTSGSGDKGTPIVFIQGYFDNYTAE